MIVGYKEALLSRKRIHEWIFSGSKDDIRKYILSFVTEREWKDFLASCSTYSKPAITPLLREETHEEVKESNSVRTYQLLDPRYLDYPTPERRSRRIAPRVRSKRQNKRRNQLSIAKRRDHKLESGSDYDEIMLESDQYIMESSVEEEWYDDRDWYNDRDWYDDRYWLNNRDWLRDLF
jgi:hypothetical protein